MAQAGMAMRDLRALRYDPPGYAKHGARRTTFQSALEQCEQFVAAARDAGYATRPVQLFYALSQASRAIVAASPRISNQAWRVNGHGLAANTNAPSAPDVTVTATKTGLFPSLAAALGLEPLVADEPTALSELWPLLPEATFVPLNADSTLPVLFFAQHGQPDAPFSQAEIAWIPHRVKDLYGDDPAQVKRHLDHYPALRDSTLLVSGPRQRLEWTSTGPGLGLRVKWRSGAELGNGTPLMLADSKTIDDLGVASYYSADDFVITPAIGSMSAALHPILALWAVLLALSSLARYEPASWSKMADIDRSADANPIEHLLDAATDSIPAATRNLLTSLK
ncbi:MAG TPA: YaaC family protein [Streptosporangiaceae bacterium]|nr:YaaC family protein [Streptosporangiaceae bacterium]